jgi:hypothetical protein
MQTIADFRRSATAGSRWMCLNRLHPEASGLRTVTGGSTVLTFTGQQCGDLSTFTDGRLDIPKPAEVRIDGDSVHALYEPGSDRVAWTWTLLPIDAHGDALTPPPVFAASPIKARLRGPDSTPWCVYDPILNTALTADGQPATAAGDAAYFATQAQAEHAADQWWPTGAQWRMHGLATPPGTWAYTLDDFGVEYGPGPWPFHNDRDHEPCGVRLSPDTAYYAWSNEHVSVSPRRFARAATTLDLFVRQRGGGAVIVPCRISFDLLFDTFTVGDSCPPQLREQATSKAQKVLDLITAARRERDTYLRPWTARDQYTRHQAASRGEPSTIEREQRNQPLPQQSDVAADVLVVRQARDVWQRVGPDAWVTAEIGGAPELQFHRRDTAEMLLYGPVQPVLSPPPAELERRGKTLSRTGQTIGVAPDPGSYRRHELTVRLAAHGFVAGPSTRGFTEAVHLTATGLYDHAGPATLVDRTGQPIAVGDTVNEYTNGWIGPEPPGQLVGTFKVVAVDTSDWVLFTDRYADRGLAGAVTMPADVEVTPAPPEEMEF